MRRFEQAATLADFKREIDERGFSLWRKVVPELELADLRGACAASSVPESSARRANELYARRNLLADVPEVHALAHSAMLQSLVRSVLGPEFTVVRALLFDKVPEANWHVGWHQDLMIPLAKRHDVPGYSAWSEKAGVDHAKPPTAVLEQMLTLRVHLDDCDADNGPLRLMAGRHLQGELAREDLLAAIESASDFTCVAAAGEVLAMRPLTPHASSRATQPAHRRVVHLEFAPDCLPAPLRWPTWT